MSACPDPSVLDAFLLGRLAEAPRRALELHLDGCSACATVVAELARMYGDPSRVELVDASHTPSMAGERDDASRTTISAHAPAEGESPPGTVGRYRLVRRLGQGGMGVVYEANDPELHRRVAIKLLHPGVGGDAEATRMRMLREARAMAQLAHPNVVAVHDVGRVGGQVFVAMELVEGTTLAAWLRARPRRLAEILEVFVQAGRGLQAAHAVGLVHRDFKPDNVLIGADARARVTDFGLARPTVAWPSEGEPVALPGDGSATATIQGLTAHGTIVGTPAYMAPEQWRGEIADARSDQFAFCVALYEAVFGSRPFAGADLHALADQVLRGSPRVPPRSAPAWLRTAILRGLARDPGQRHASLTPLLEALARDRNRWRRVGAVALAMAASVGATVAVLAYVSRATAPAPHDDALPLASAPSPAAIAAPVVPAFDAACAAQAATLGGRWTSERRADLVARIASMEHGDAIASRTLPVLDDWTARWIATRTAGCAGTPATAAIACLDRAALAFESTIQLALELPSFEVDGSLAHAAHALPRLEACSDDRWLAVEPTPPGDTAARIGVLRNDLAAAEALTALDRLVRAPESLAQVVADAEAVGWPPAVAEAQLALGHALAEKYEADDAARAFEAAALAAQGGVHERVLVDAAIGLVEQRGAAMLRVGEGERWHRIATQSLARLPDPELEIAARLAHAELTHAAGEYARAREAFTAVIELARDRLGQDHPLRARAELELAEVLLELGDADAAARAAESGRADDERSLGADDLRHARGLYLVGRAALLHGDLAGAERTARAAIAIPFPSESLRHDLDRGTYHGLLLATERARGDGEAALATCDTAAIYLYVGPAKALPVLWRAQTLAALARPREALAAARAAREELAGQLGADDPRMIAMLRAVAVVQHDAGDLSGARGSLEHALALAETALGPGALHGIVAWELAAIAREAGDRSGALALYDEGHLSATEAWGRDHPRAIEATLARADLAWELDQREYAVRLYGVVVDDLSARYGPKDGRAARARTRARG